MGGIVVVGAGQAGHTLVETLRKRGYQGPLTLIGEEPHQPYQRPPLSKKYLLGEMELERLYLRPRSFYDDHDITLKLGVAVRTIDRAARQVVLSDGAAVAYETLALTTGSSPRRLPDSVGGGLAGVYTIRGLADVDAMAPEFEAGRRVLVIGGGYIGLEAAAVAARRGLHVDLVEMAPRILNRVAAEETANYFRDLHRSHGVTIREGVGLDRLTGADRVTGAVLSDGTELALNFAIAGVGIEPETRLAEDAGLAIDNGIAVDGLGRTSDPAIYAAGDCTSFPYLDQRIRLESVPNAIDQAQIVAAAMTGAEEPYVARPWFWSDQYETKLQIAGLNTGFDRIVTRPGQREGAVSFWYFKDLKLLAVDAMNDPRAYMIGKRWLEARRSPDPGTLANPDADLKTMDTV